MNSMIKRRLQKTRKLLVACVSALQSVVISELSSEATVQLWLRLHHGNTQGCFWAQPPHRIFLPPPSFSISLPLLHCFIPFFAPNLSFLHLFFSFCCFPSFPLCKSNSNASRPLLHHHSSDRHDIRGTRRGLAAAAFLDVLETQTDIFMTYSFQYDVFKRV